MKQFLKYWLGGGVYFWSGYGVFALCYSAFKFDWLPSKIAADAVGWTLNYFVQRYWAFASDRLKLSEMQHVGRYLTIESVGFVLDYLIIWGLRSIGVTPYIGFFIAAGFFTVWSWLWYKYWVFPEEKKVLYHASANKELEIINPQHTLSKDKYIGDFVFATADKSLAVMYLANKGVANIMNNHSSPKRIFIRDDEDNYLKNDKGGAIYELRAGDFEDTPQAELSEFEKVSKAAVKPLKKNTYESSLKAMQDEGIHIYFVVQEDFDLLLSDENEDAVVSRIQPYLH